MNDYSIILDTDSYKVSHWRQYPPGTESMFSYIESRGGEYDETVFFGLQYYIKKYLSRPITMDQIDRAARFYEKHGVPFNRKGWEHIVRAHDGRLPVRIRAVPEGTVVPTHQVLVTVESTDPKVFWLASWLETLLVRLWYPITTATKSHAVRNLILQYLRETGDESEIDFKLHDFGSRGVSSQESAAIGGAAHLINFKGSDTIVGAVLANEFYDSEMSAFSIPAAEHSTITAWGQEGETEAYRNMLVQFAKPGSVLAVVSDSYDIYNAIDKIWGGELRQEVIDSGATVVIRPDSGDPVEVVSKCLKLLDKRFGSTVNEKGFKVLNHVRVIQGDGVNPKSIEEILERTKQEGYSASNIAFGMGGGLLQQHNRDTLKFAMKCSSVTVNGEERDVFKDPVTDHGKMSKKGRLDLVYDRASREYKTIRLNPGVFARIDTALKTVFQNGRVYNTTTLDRIRKRANG